MSYKGVFFFIFLGIVATNQTGVIDKGSGTSMTESLKEAPLGNNKEEKKDDLRASAPIPKPTSFQQTFEKCVR